VLTGNHILEPYYNALCTFSRTQVASELNVYTSSILNAVKLHGSRPNFIDAEITF